jgi:hypothetical protein
LGFLAVGYPIAEGFADLMSQRLLGFGVTVVSLGRSLCGRLTAKSALFF